MPRIPYAVRDETLNATRTRLLQAALVEIAQKGFAEANINHISETAGFSKGTIYNYFPSKQALMLALIDEAGAAHVRYITQRLQAVMDPAKRLVCFFESGFQFIEEFPAQAQFLITTLYSPGVEMQKAMFRAYQPMFRLVAQEILAPGVEQGLFRPMDVQVTTNLLMMLYLGSGSHVDEHGKVFMDPHQVADFARRALQHVDENETSGD